MKERTIYWKMLLEYIVLIRIFNKEDLIGYCALLNYAYPKNIGLQKTCPILWSFKPKVNYHEGGYWFDPTNRWIRIKLLIKCI